MPREATERKDSMKTSYSGKNFTVTSGMKEHLYEKMSKLDRFGTKLVESHVVLKKERYVFEVEITLLGKNLRVFGDGKSKENIYTAIDLAASRIETQLKKFRGKVTAHHRHRGLTAETAVPKVQLAEKLNSGRGESAPDRPRIIASDEYEGKPMSAEEAGMQLELLNNIFLVFLNAKTKKPNVIYKRKDGNHGLIEPNF